MKKYLFGLAAMLVLVGLYATSCSKDLDIDQVTAPEENQPQTRSSIYSEHLATLESMGYCTESIKETEDYYVVEGDIVIMKEDIEAYLSEPQTRQARTQFIIKNGRENDIRVSTGALTNNDWKSALIVAMDEWNNIPGCNVFFRHVDGWGGEMNVYMNSAIDDFDDPDRRTIAQANPPSAGGYPGVMIEINPYYNYLSHESKISVMVHELGHILGLGHTNPIETWDGDSHIDGTPWEEWNSVMHQGSYDRPWLQPNPHAIDGSLFWFTGGDILAIQSLYGWGPHWVDIEGPTTLAPGQEATYNLITSELLDDYLGNFNMPDWSVTGTDVGMEIVSQTRTSVTVRNNDTQLRPFTIYTATYYNNSPRMEADHELNAEVCANNYKVIRDWLGYQGFSSSQISTIMNGGTYAQWRHRAKNMNVVNPTLVDYIFDNPNDPIDENFSARIAVNGPDTVEINTEATYYATTIWWYRGLSFVDLTVTGGNYTRVDQGGGSSFNYITFHEAKRYTVTVRYKFPNGQIYPVNKVVDVTLPAPVISANKTSAAFGEAVTFTVNNHQAGLTYRWIMDYGNNRSSADTNGSTFTTNVSAPTFSVYCIAIYNNNQSSNSNTVTVVTTNPYIPVVSASVTSAPPGTQVTFTVTNPMPGCTYSFSEARAVEFSLLSNSLNSNGTSGTTYTTTTDNYTMIVYCRAYDSYGNFIADAEPVRVTTIGYTPVIQADKTSIIPGGSVTFTVLFPKAGVTYKWWAGRADTVFTFYQLIGEGSSATFTKSFSTLPQKIYCQAVVNGQPSNNSNYVTITNALASVTPGDGGIFEPIDGGDWPIWTNP